MTEVSINGVACGVRDMIVSIERTAFGPLEGERDPIRVQTYLEGSIVGEVDMAVLDSVFPPRRLIIQLSSSKPLHILLPGIKYSFADTYWIVYRRSFASMKVYMREVRS